VGIAEIHEILHKIVVENTEKYQQCYPAIPKVRKWSPGVSKSEPKD
jgi:hypothetical protein